MCWCFVVVPVPCWCSPVFSMMTMATPIFAVSTILEVSCLSSVNALHSCMVRLVLWLWLIFLSMQLISDVYLFPWGSLEQVSSTTVMYASLGDTLGLWLSLGLLPIGILVLV